MEENNFEKFENKLSVIQCQLDKIITITKVLNQTLIENCDYEIKDSQNLCLLLVQETISIKNKLSEFENTFFCSQTGCR